MKLPIAEYDGTQPAELSAQREYVACTKAGLGFTSQTLDCGRLWLYRLGGGEYAALLVQGTQPPRTLVRTVGPERVEWIPWLWELAMDLV